MSTPVASNALAPSSGAARTTLPILFAISSGHLLNDTTQSFLPLLGLLTAFLPEIERRPSA